MGLGRSIAVLTSGGDAQGKHSLHYFTTAWFWTVDTQNESVALHLPCRCVWVQHWIPTGCKKPPLLRGPTEYHVYALHDISRSFRSQRTERAWHVRVARVKASCRRFSWRDEIAFRIHNTTRVWCIFSPLKCQTSDREGTTCIVWEYRLYASGLNWVCSDIIHSGCFLLCLINLKTSIPVRNCSINCTWSSTGRRLIAPDPVWSLSL